MILPSRLRKFALIVHLTCSVGWIGAVIVYLALGVSARKSAGCAGGARCLDRDGADRMVCHCTVGCRLAADWVGDGSGHSVGVVPALLGRDLTWADAPFYSNPVSTHARRERDDGNGATSKLGRTRATWRRFIASRGGAHRIAHNHGAQCLQAAGADPIWVAETAGNAGSIGAGRQGCCGRVVTPQESAKPATGGRH